MNDRNRVYENINTNVHNDVYDHNRVYDDIYTFADNGVIANNYKNVYGNIKNNVFFIDFMSDIENILLDIVNVVMKRSLYQYNSDFNTVKDYFIVGGKAINKIISVNKLKPSFDFDIHLSTNLNVKDFIVKIEDNTKKIVNELYRHFIYIHLLKHDLITSNEHYYYFNETIFVYGARQKPTKLIPGLFFKLKLKKGLLDNGTTELYYPIADVGLDCDIHTKLCIKNNIDANIFKREYYDGLYYATFPIIIFNLCNYTAITYGQKRKKNLSKLKLLIDPRNYSCEMITKTSYMPNDITNLFNKISTVYKENINETKVYAPDLNIEPVYLDNINIFSTSLTIRELITIFTDKFNSEKNNIIKNCENNSILNQNNYDEYDDGLIKHTNFINSAIELIMDNDNLRYVLAYTTNIYSDITKYLQYKQFGIIQNNNTYKNIDITISNLNTPSGKLSYNIEILPNKCDVMDDYIHKKIYEVNKLYHTDQNIIPLFNDLNDVFNVYRVQNFGILNGDGSIFSPEFFASNKNKSSILYVPHYLSSTFSSRVILDNFIKETSFIMVIKINKKLSNWIILDKYSRYKNERELLINKNSYLVITNISYHQKIKSTLSILLLLMHRMKYNRQSRLYFRRSSSPIK